MFVTVKQWQTMGDNELVVEYIKGQLNAFECLYQRHKGSSYRFILRQVKENAAAEDLLQELWIKVISNIRQFKQDAKFTTWLYRMARNLLTDRFRHLEVVAGVVAVESSEVLSQARASDSADDGVNRARQKRALQHCLTKLPKAQLEAFLLKEEGNLTRSDVAKVTGVSLEAAKSRLRAAYEGLRICIDRVLGVRDDE